MGRLNKIRPKVIILFGLAVVFLFSGWGRKKIRSIAFEVNEQNKDFKGEWIHKPVMRSIKEKIRLSVSGNKFAIDNSIIYDGKTVHQIDFHNKEVRKFVMPKWRTLSFWMMPIKMTPFGPAQKIGEGIIAGRKTDVYEIRGKYEGANVFLTYWVDKEKKVLLKKEHIIGPKNDPLLMEFYECQKIEFEPSFPEDAFVCKIPSDFLEVNLRYLGIDLLDTKF